MPITQHPDDTIVALSSAPGAGLRAIVRLSGPQAWEVVASTLQLDAGDRHKPAKRVLITTASSIDQIGTLFPVQLYFWPGPRTYTGQDLAELHTLSCPPLVDQLVAGLLAAGARAAGPGEFTLRAFLSGKKDLPKAEAVLGVIEARDEADLTLALKQLAGGLSRPTDELRSDLLNLLADIEAALDFVDEDIEFVPQAEVLIRLSEAMARLKNLLRQLDGRTVSDRAIRVALVGEPNAGKSSLFNRLVGNEVQALVSPQAGTTRDYLTARIELAGVPVELIDTAGWQQAGSGIEEQAQRLGRTQADQADLILWCSADGQFPDPDRQKLAAVGNKLLRLHTKADLIEKRVTLTHDADASDKPIACSAISIDGILELQEALTERVVSLARSPLAPSQSRCRHHLEQSIAHLQAAHCHVLFEDPPELTASALRAALDQIGELAGAVYTNDLLDRIFSRFCIGK